MSMSDDELADVDADPWRAKLAAKDAEIAGLRQLRDEWCETYVNARDERDAARALLRECDKAIETIQRGEPNFGRALRARIAALLGAA